MCAPEPRPAQRSGPLVLGVAIVDFHHQVGPQVEWACPASLHRDLDLVNQLPFYALPDGSHQFDEGMCLFHLAAPATRPVGTVYGLACNRQVDASKLVVRDASMTRATIQKAVVVLTSAPVFSPVRQKLAIVTRVFLDQRDLTDRALLTDFASSLEDGLRASLRQCARDAHERAQHATSDLIGLGLNIPSQETQAAPTKARMDDEDPASLLALDATLSMGSNLRQLVFDWRADLLVLLKLLLLQQRVMVFGCPTEALCSMQYDLISLVPGLLASLDDCAQVKSLPESVPPGTLPLFSGNAVFHPYLPLQQIQLLTAQSWLVGTSNSVMLSQQEAQMDVLINLETRSIDIRTPGNIPRLHQEQMRPSYPSSPSIVPDHLSRPEESVSSPIQRQAPVSDTACEQKPINNDESVSPFRKQLFSDADAPVIKVPQPNTQAELREALRLTAADKRWMEEDIIPALLDTWDESNPSRTTTLSYRGSDDWLRAQFQDYIGRLLTSVYQAENAEQQQQGRNFGLFGTMPNTPVDSSFARASHDPATDDSQSAGRPSAPHPSPLSGSEGIRTSAISNSNPGEKETARMAVSLAHFGKHFVRTLRATEAYRLWRASISGQSISGPTGHPFESRLSMLEGVSARLAATLDDTRAAALGKNLATASTASLRWFASALGPKQSLSPPPLDFSGSSDKDAVHSSPAASCEPASSSPSKQGRANRPCSIELSRSAIATAPLPNSGSSTTSSAVPLSAALSAWGSMGTYFSSWGNTVSPLSRSASARPATRPVPKRQTTAPLPETGKGPSAPSSARSLGRGRGHISTVSSAGANSSSAEPMPEFSSVPTVEEQKFVPPLARWRSRRGKENVPSVRQATVRRTPAPLTAAAGLEWDGPQGSIV